MRLPRLPGIEKQLCREYGLQAREFYSGRDWPDVEPLVQRMWHRQARALAWSEARPIIHAAWRDASAATVAPAATMHAATANVVVQDARPRA